MLKSESCFEVSSQNQILLLSLIATFQMADGGGEIQSWDREPTLFQGWLSKINSMVPWENLTAAISFLEIAGAML